jgi:hypothetical protein
MQPPDSSLARCQSETAPAAPNTSRSALAMAFLGMEKLAFIVSVIERKISFKKAVDKIPIRRYGGYQPIFAMTDPHRQH